MLINYAFLKERVIGPVLRHYSDATVVGLDNIPATGPVILAAKHEAIIDTFWVAALSDRPARSFAKEEYFTSQKWYGGLMRWFFTRMEAVCVYRSDPVKAELSVQEGLDVLRQGGVLIIHPEGGRSIDGRVYRATLSFIDMAVQTGAVIVPVGIIGTRQVNPIGDRQLHKGPITIIFEKPVSIATHHLPGNRLKLLEKRLIAKSIMTTIARISHAQYVDKDLKVIKAELLEHDNA